LCGIHRYHRQQQSSLIPQQQEQKQQEQKQRSNQNRNYPLTTNSNIEKEVDFYTNPTDLFRVRRYCYDTRIIICVYT